MAAIRFEHSHRGARPLIRAIVGAVSVLLLMMWIAIPAHLADSRGTAVEDARAEARNLAIAFRTEVAHFVQDVEDELNVVAEKMQRTNGAFDLYGWGKESPSVAAGRVQITMVGSDGALKSTTIEPSPPATDFTDRAYFQAHIDGQFHGLYVGQTVTDRISHKPIVPISWRVETEEGSFLGVLIALVPPATLTTLHTSIDLGPNGLINLTGLDHRVLARFSADSPDGLKGIGSSVAGAPRPDVIGEGAEGTFVRQSRVDGVTRIFAYSRVGKYPLVVTVGLDLDNELAAWWSNAKLVLLLGLGATAILIALAAYLIREIRIRAAREADLVEERTRIEAANIELTEAKGRAEAAAQAKSLLLANMSHELRTPLNAIIGYSELIRDQAFGPGAVERYSDYARDIHGSGSNLLRMIGDILDTAQIEAGKLTLNDDIIDLVGLVERCLVQVRLVIENKQLRLETTVEDGLRYLRGDERRLGQVLINLLGNAVKFTEAGGSVGVRIGRGPNGEAICTVSDSGIGMSADEIDVALALFSQVDNALTKTYEGTGLGLPLARRLVELHGGTLTIGSEKGRGTSVSIVLAPDRVVAADVETSAAASN